MIVYVRIHSYHNSNRIGIMYQTRLPISYTNLLLKIIKVHYLVSITILY